MGDSRESGVFETGTGIGRRTFDRVSRLLPVMAPRALRAPVVIAAIVVLSATAAGFHGTHGNSVALANIAPDNAPLPNASDSGTPSASPSPTPGPIGGNGPIVVWTSQLPTGDIGIFGLDLGELDSGTDPVLLGTTPIIGGALGSPIGQTTQATSLPILVNTNGVNRLLLVQRAGVAILDPSVGFPQSPNSVLLNTSDTELAVLINGERGLALHLQNLRTRATHDILIRIPSDALGDSRSPQLVARYDQGRRFLIRFLNFDVPGNAPMYSLDLAGRLTPMPWLDGQEISADGMLPNQKSFFYGQGTQLRLADSARRSLRTIVKLHDNTIQDAIVSPDGSRVAYVSASRIKIVRASDGRSLLDGSFDPTPNLTPLAWIDSDRLLALAVSADLITGTTTQAILLLDTRVTTGDPPIAFFNQVTAGGPDLNFVGVLR